MLGFESFGLYYSPLKVMYVLQVTKRILMIVFLLTLLTAVLISRYSQAKNKYMLEFQSSGLHVALSR